MGSNDSKLARTGIHGLFQLLGLVPMTIFLLSPKGALCQLPSRELSVPEQIASEYANSVVLVAHDEPNGIVMGTGFFIRPDIVATDLHVVKGATTVFLKFRNGTILKSDELLAYDYNTDAALIKLSSPAPVRPIPLGNSDAVRQGEPIIVISNPEGVLEESISNGLVSAKRNKGDGSILFQISAPISPGSSGGPVFDLHGEVVAVVVSTVERGQNLNFATPASYFKVLLSAPKPIKLTMIRPKASTVSERTRQLMTPNSGGPPLPNKISSGVLFVAYRTPRHRKYSSEDVFQSITDDLLLFLKAHKVLLSTGAGGRTIETEARPSIYNLLDSAQNVGASSLLFLTVDRPVASWVKIELRCFDMSGNLRWAETTSDGGWGHFGEKGVQNAVARMEDKLLRRLGKPGLPLERISLGETQ